MTKRALSILLAVLFLLTAFPLPALAEDELPPEELPTDEVCNNEEQKETESYEEYDYSYLEEIAHQGAINRDIQIYSQWDVDAYGDGDSNWLNTSGCGWFSLGHMLQWLGIVPKDAENGNAMPCKLYKESGINTVSSFNSAAQWVANKYSTSLSMTGDKDVKSILKDSGVAIINQYGHFYAAVELSADENYVHIIDSCLSVPYQNGVTAYTSSGTQVPLKSCAARTNQPWYCAEGYVMNKASLSWSEIWTYSGGSYWVTVGEVAGHVRCAFYCKGGMQDSTPTPKPIVSPTPSPTPEDLSQWSMEKPINAYDSQVETATQYRYSYRNVWTNMIITDQGTIDYVKEWPAGFNRSHTCFTTYRHHIMFE